MKNSKAFFFPTRYHRDIVENSKAPILPTQKNKTRTEIFIPDQGQNWWTLLVLVLLSRFHA